MAILPEAPGILPYWLLTVRSPKSSPSSTNLILSQIATIASANAIQTYFTLQFTEGIYNPGTVSQLSSRTFGTWSFVNALIRFYAAYNITHPALYQLTMWTYAVALAHFLSEWLYFRSARVGRGLVTPLIVASSSFVWMVAQRDFYSNSGLVITEA